MDYEVPVTQARAEFAELINRAAYAGDRTIVTRHGKPIAALISAADLERLRTLDENPGVMIRLGGGLAHGPGGAHQPSPTADLDLAAQHHPAQHHPAPNDTPS
ncbi:type II toxin-antitoxin system Phd/YefM family antitoxin [Actinoplanes sp. N902-109]|uniref:type II toxin-antitoxin system Phd/YefM family antitoxin n=1 Tax=Actinoplanes sp. (strain N902-109) TaxID=649831 RepID=UPI00032963F4|nr:type II toxin-antitoxin system Phd/YefM family antitoxin [Actinoplanes sp. N902-109]AGL20124.1 hypothetical protein L083_6614 [Actinoplanes sp. N902-109]